jgi:hypothetical protein
MKFFNFKRKREEVLDLSERYKRQQEQLKQIQEENKAIEPQTFASSSQSASDNAFGFLGNMASAGNTDSPQPQDEYLCVSEDINEKRKKLTKRIMDMTEKLEELSNQIYHLEQRIDVLEKKSGVGR